MPQSLTYTETPNCPLCERPINNRVNAQRYTFDSASVTRCSCGLWGLTPRIPETEMIHIYQSDSYFHSDGDNGYSDYDQQSDSLRLTFRTLLKNIQTAHRIPGGLLEIGTGDGLLLHESMPFYHYRAGTDFSEQAAKKAKAFADDVFVGGIESIPSGYLARHNIRTVIATNVIEHVYDPIAFARSIFNELSSGSILVLAAPDMGGFWRKLLGEKWPSFKLPEHVFYFDDASLAALLEKAGFAETKRVSCPHYFPIGSLMEKAGLNPDILPDNIARRPVKLNGIMTAVIGIKS